MTKRDLTDKCVHFRGIGFKTCKAGVDWQAITGGDDFGIAKRMPCFKSNNSAAVCEFCHYITVEEAVVMEAEQAEYLRRSDEDMQLIMAAHTDEATSLVYVCELCDRSARTVTTTPQEAMTHAIEAHGLDGATIRTAEGSRSAHLDAANWFQNDDRFTLPDGRALLIRSRRLRRRGADRAIWQDEVPTGKRRSRRSR